MKRQKKLKFNASEWQDKILFEFWLPDESRGLQFNMHKKIDKNACYLSMDIMMNLDGEVKVKFGKWMYVPACDYRGLLEDLANTILENIETLNDEPDTPDEEVLSDDLPF